MSEYLIKIINVQRLVLVAVNVCLITLKISKPRASDQPRLSTDHLYDPPTLILDTPLSTLCSLIILLSPPPSGLKLAQRRVEMVSINVSCGSGGGGRTEC